MPQVWVPLEALTEGQLPPVCLVTGARDGVQPREVSLPWVSAATRGQARFGDTAVVAAMTPEPYLRVRLPLTEEGSHRYAMSRKTGWVILAGLFAPAFFGGGIFGGWGAVMGLGLGIAGAIAYAVYFGRGTAIGLARRVGSDVLLEVSNAQAAEVLSSAFPGVGDEPLARHASP